MVKAEKSLNIDLLKPYPENRNSGLHVIKFEWIKMILVLVWLKLDESTSKVSKAWTKMYT